MLREGLPLPVAVARRWLTGAKSGDAGGIADEDGKARRLGRAAGAALARAG